jgi:biopolymer transport protein TolR
MPAMVSRGSGRRRTISEINMVPFIDVMLVLLIIFMVTAPLIAPSMIDLPSIGRAAKAPDQVIQVTIRKDESIELKTGDKSAPTTFDALADAVVSAQAGHAPGTSAVVIAADKSVKYENVVKVMDALQKKGVQRIGLSVQVAK